MKNFTLAIFFASVLFILSGCSSYETSIIYLQGAGSLIQSNCAFQLNGVRAKRIHSVTNSHDLRLAWDFGDVANVNALLLTFGENGKQVTVNSIHGSYENASSKPQSLELAYLDKSNAVFVLNTNLTDRLEFGRYSINLSYYYSSQSNACNFTVNYNVKSEMHSDIIWPWDITRWWAYRGGGGP